MNKLRSLFVLGALFSLASCSLVYQPVKNEGTVILPSQVEQVRVGYNKEQVLYLLGSPNVYSQTSDTWYYVERVIDQRNNVTEKVYFVSFANDKVVRQGYQKEAPNQ